MLQNYTKVFIKKSVLIPVPSNVVPPEIQALSTLRSVRKWLEGLYETPRKVSLEISIDAPFWSLFLALHEQIIAAGGWVRNPQNELLVIERKGVLDMPKGKLESKEDIATAAIREVEEECRIQHVHIVGAPVKTYHCYRYKKEFALKTSFWYPMESAYQGDLKPQIEEDITAVYWANKDRVSDRLSQIGSYNSLHAIFEQFAAGEQAFWNTYIQPPA